VASATPSAAGPTAGPVLVTGAAGFIGSHLAGRLLDAGRQVVGVDNLNGYYDVRLKQARLDRLVGRPGFAFHRLDLADREATARLFAEVRPARVAHLGAQVGVRYSVENPAAYVDANLVGFGNVLEGCRAAATGHLLFASSSSVYGANTALPFAVGQTVDHPISLYAATKKANELMAHAYAHLYRLPVTGLRFFTVYGPWGRPDMAVFKFTEAILRGEPIDVYNHGDMSRDFTYVDDVVESLVRLIDHPASPDPAWTGAAPSPATSNAPYRVYNIGNNRPEPLARLIAAIEAACGLKATLRLKPMQPGDVPATFADIGDLEREIGFRPATPIELGIARFVDWYRSVWQPIAG
jgi:UDP-glucuronate 4-epimerase